MKLIELGKSGNIKVTEEDNSKSWIIVEQARKRRNDLALEKAKAFIGSYPEQVSNLLGENADIVSGAYDNPAFWDLVEVMKNARVGKDKFLSEITQHVVNSFNSPEEGVAEMVAQKFTDVIYSEKKRLQIETNGRRQSRIIQK